MLACIQSYLQGHTTLYIDTEGTFSAARLVEMAFHRHQMEGEALASSVHLIHIQSATQLRKL